MKLALIIIISISFLAGGIYYFTVDRSLSDKVSMPWHINVLDEHHIEVFDITLNETTLEQGRVRFGQLDGLALYQNLQGVFSLEAYFGKVSFGPLDARVIANLDVSQTDLKSMAEDAIKRMITDKGNTKWTLSDDVKRLQALRKIKSLTYIPSFGGLDAEFIKQRFGDPEKKETVDETTEQWLYPNQGVRILLDSEGKEVFEYMVPAEFKQLQVNNSFGEK